MDFTAPLAPLGFFFGRMGNFINAELWGRVADPALPWAMIWPRVDALPRHPSPIYQALVDGLLLFIILWIYARKPRPRMAVVSFGVMMYGCARFFTEYFRTPDYEVALGGITLSAGQMLSLPMILGGGLLLLYAYRQDRKQRQTNSADKPAHESIQ
jgi:phosphatidylglycerol:prolipoprotein diacylglycerol transferase